MVKTLGIVALAAAALMPTILASAQSRRSPLHAGYGTRHAQRHYHGTYYFHDGTNSYVPQILGNARAERPIPIKFGGYAHVDDLSGRLERLANQLCLDLHYNYSHNPGFADIYREAYQVFETAKYIHAKEHQSDKRVVALRVDELDGLFHHVQGEVARMSRQHHRQIGLAGVQSKLDAVETTLHHLMNDVGVNGSHRPPEAAPPPANVEVAPPPSSLAPPTATN